MLPRGADELGIFDLLAGCQLSGYGYAARNGRRLAQSGRLSRAEAPSLNKLTWKAGAWQASTLCRSPAVFELRSSLQQFLLLRFELSLRQQALLFMLIPTMPHPSSEKIPHPVSEMIPHP
jgi:hypothetical protein